MSPGDTIWRQGYIASRVLLISATADALVLNLRQCISWANADLSSVKYVKAKSLDGIFTDKQSPRLGPGGNLFSVVSANFRYGGLLALVSEALACVETG